jgi:hypothetical protein
MNNEQRILRAVDELEIRNLICRVAQLADECPVENLSEYIANFTEDATWEFRPAPGVVSPDRPRRGHADILQGAKERRAGGVQGPGTHNRHVITTTQVKISGDVATASSYMFWVKQAAKPELAFLVVLTDSCRRTVEGWKLSGRIVASG